jgi:hypothetical protein
VSENRIPCSHCHGRGTELTALELWDGLSSTLRALMWPDDRIAELKGELRLDEILAGMPRWGGIELKSPDGTIRTLDRFRNQAECKATIY